MRARDWRKLGLAMLLGACSTDAAVDSGSNAASPDAGGGTSSGGPGSSGDGGATDAGADASDAALAPNADIPGGGTILFQEKFDDASFAGRGWYDAPAGKISAAEHAAGSTSSLQCDFAVAATGCTNGAPARHKFTPTETIYLGVHMKFSTNWVGSGKAYHPHMLHFVTDADNDYVGFANTHLTTYTEVVWNGATGTGTAQLALQDTLNVDPNCVLLNNNSFSGCNGNFATYAFTENRSVCACNGVAGDVDQRDCFSLGSNMWYSARTWASAGAFSDTAGSAYKSDWHFVEAYFQMNSIQGGVGVPDGKIRWVQDGKTLIAHDHVLLRTAAHPTMKFVQHAIAPYIGDGSPIAQTLWLDDITVATARP